MQISEIQIIPVKPKDGLIAFASCVINNALYLGSIAIFTKHDGTFRLVFPTRKIGDLTINIFHPINKDAGSEIEEKIINHYEEVLKGNNDRYNSTDHI